MKKSILMLLILGFSASVQAEEVYGMMGYQEVNQTESVGSGVMAGNGAGGKAKPAEVKKVDCANTKDPKVKESAECKKEKK